MTSLTKTDIISLLQIRVLPTIISVVGISLLQDLQYLFDVAWKKIWQEVFRTLLEQIYVVNVYRSPFQIFF